ncbi:glycosyltransferase [Notoacmeibacter sp. MSK16QG-6]|uniref:glycosyltransferase n=1 Tax=Notoacmeibacter sp. MSK16QG-6 TaxID=2957982 RepID=UPI00209EE3F7|nr:glycosyltransferase [Notoacmeibacter sp. MSK16QG-6]MCP1198262.1 glycosyltransferase [Notoacmeibacter sp. MSK16QG-6]
MLTVILETHNDEEALARTLASLVSAAVDGTVREVIVCDTGSTDHTRKVAEMTGCIFLAGGDTLAAIRRAKAEWLLLLEPGSRPTGFWREGLGEHMAASTKAARFRLSKASRPPFLRRLRRNGALYYGLLITKRQALALCKPHRSLESVGTGLATRPLDVELHPATARMR